MATQNRTWQRRRIDDAKTAGDLPRLFWFIEMDLPAGLRPRPDARHLPATYPPGFVPVIPAGPDPEEQREYAEIMQICFEAANAGRRIEFNLALTDASLLTSFYWYQFGEEPTQEIDHVCPLCGSIRRGPATRPPACTMHSEATQ